jgi:hypothetical protein
MGRSLALASFGLALLAWGCDQQLPPAPPFAGPPAPVRSAVVPLASFVPCTDSFVPHTLDFTTTVRTPAIHLFDSNGAGVAAGDLDGDGRIDLVFANLDGPDTIFWNAGGRGMVMADLNGDGRLDIAVNNLRDPAQVFENRLCGGASLEVDLRWPDSGNTRAVGARLALHTSAGSYYRDVRAGSGYLSGDPSQVHFGFATGATTQKLDIAWPDGSVSSVDAPAAGTLLTVTRLP